MAFCEHCGRELSDQAVACPSCGHPPAPVATIATRATGYAEWWQRAVAFLIDLVITAVPAGILIALVGFRNIGSLTSTDEFGNQTLNQTLNADAVRHLALAALIGVAVGVVYRTILEGSARGQTVGKMAMGIAVKDADSGGPIGYGRAFGRWLVGYVLWVVVYIPGIIDLLFPLWDSKRQTLHDKAVHSVVVQVRQNTPG